MRGLLVVQEVLRGGMVSCGGELWWGVVVMSCGGELWW